MPYALLQTDLTVPPVEKLKQAFRASRILTELDAFTVAADAFGILVKNLPVEKANQLQADLRAAGVETEVVEASGLPALPATKFVHRMNCTAEALMIYDPLGRAFPLAWGHILMIAAGVVRLTEFNPVRTSRPVITHDTYGSPIMDSVPETSHREERNYHLMLEIILSRAVLRYSVTADKFNFLYLGPRKTASVQKNFELLVQDLASSAPQAQLNRGALAVRDHAPELFSYPTKNAFFEEITWLLWRMAQSATT